MTLPERGDFLAYVMDVYEEAVKVAPLQAGLTAAQAEVARLTLLATNQTTVINDLTDTLAIVRQQLADCQAGTTPDPPPDPDPDPDPEPTTKALLGMSAPASLWDERQAQVEATGGHLQARRIFLTSFTASLSKASEAIADGLLPVLSFKTGSYSWGQVASGAADKDLGTLATRLAALDGDVFVAIHHEPAGDGVSTDWAAMQTRALPILGMAANVSVGVIGNGWWWSGTQQGLSDSEIAAYITPQVRSVCDVVAGDTYSSSAEGSAPKMRNMSAWKARVGFTGKLGVGEFNSATAADITAACDELATNPDFAWGCVWNSTGGSFTPLTGDRLTAFQTALADW